MKKVKNTTKDKLHVPIFLASDDNYIPYLAVTLRSIADHSSSAYVYDVKILSGGLNEENVRLLCSMELDNLRVEIVDVRKKIERISRLLRLRLRDYYSESIYYRMFIPSMYPELDRAVYIDCDTVLVSDISEMYFCPMGKNLLAAVVDETVTPIPEFCDYVRDWVGVSSDRYFNSGVLVMNLDEMRRAGVERSFARLVSLYNFDTVAPDQDYLNFLCRDRVFYLDGGWNKQPSGNTEFPSESLRLIHYNMFKKPWKYDGVQYSEYFWRTAERTPFFERIRKGYLEYSDERRSADERGCFNLLAAAKKLSLSSGGFSALAEAGMGRVCAI